MRGARRLRLALAVAAITFAIGALALPLAPRSTDYRSFYQPVAQNLRSGDGLVSRDAAPAVRYPPGHPLLLATTWLGLEPFGIGAERATDCLGVLAHVASTLLVFELGLALAGWKVAGLAALMWAGYPPALALPGTGNSEIGYVPLALLAIVMVARRGAPSTMGCFQLGLLSGAAILLRPAGIALPLALLLQLAANQPRSIARVAQRFAPVVLATVLVLAPWWIWTTMRTGAPVWLSTGGLPSMVDGWTFARHARGVQVSPGEDALTASLRRMWLDGQISGGSDLAHALLTTDPGAALRMFGRKVVRAWYATDSQRHEGILATMQAFLLGLAVVGTMRLARSDWWTANRHVLVLAGSWVLLTWASTVLVLSILRYMVPAMPIIVVLAAIGVLGVAGPARAPAASHHGR